MEDHATSASEELERSENVTIVAETFSGRAPTATVSSLKSEDSTEQLICKTPQKKVKGRATLDRRDKKEKRTEKSVSSKSLEATAVSEGGKGRKRKLVVLLGLSQVGLGALLVGAGAVAVVRGAALARVGAGLWAGCVAVVTGLVGVLAGINDCYGLHNAHGRRPLLTAFLALSLACLACGNTAAVLAATGLQRDYQRATPADSFQDEMDAWAPVLTNIALIIISGFHCLVSIISIYHLSKRICPCFRTKQPFDHNQFDPNYKTLNTNNYIVHVDENIKKCQISPAQKANHDLCKDLENKLANGSVEKIKKKKKKPEEGEFGSANSKEKLVSSWLGRHQSVLQGQAVVDRRQGKVMKYKMKPQPVMLVPAHPASTMSRVGGVPLGMLMPPRYATLPLPLPLPPHYPPPPHLYYPVHDNRARRRSPRTRVRRAGARDCQLTRSLERIHRQRRTRDLERTADTDLRRTYTGLDRAYAEQFIAVCDESRSQAAERVDSLTSTVSSDLVSGHRDSF